MRLCGRQPVSALHTNHLTFAVSSFTQTHLHFFPCRLWGGKEHFNESVSRL